MGLQIQHLLGLEGVSKEDITLILDTADSFHGVLQREIKLSRHSGVRQLLISSTKAVPEHESLLSWPKRDSLQVHSIFRIDEFG